MVYFALLALYAVITIVASSCSGGKEKRESIIRVQSPGVTDSRDDPFVFVALINDDETAQVGKLVKMVFHQRKIESLMEGGGAGLGISVRRGQVASAVKAIATAPELKGKGIAINKEFLPLINGHPEEKPRPAPLVAIAFIKDGLGKEAAEMIEMELNKRGIAATIESAGAGFRISVDKPEVDKSVRAIIAPPDLRERGVIIKEEFLYLLK
jgi:hypothetical protein